MFLPSLLFSTVYLVFWWWKGSETSAWIVLVRVRFFFLLWQCQKSQLDLAMSQFICFSFLLSRIQHHFVISASCVIPLHFSSSFGALTRILKLMTYISLNFFTHIILVLGQTLLNQSSSLPTLVIAIFSLMVVAWMPNCLIGCFLNFFFSFCECGAIW